MCSFYEDIVQTLKLASHPLYKFPKRNFQRHLGWNVYVADLHEVARDAFLLWKEEGKPRQGPVFEMKNITNTRFKYALRYIKNNEYSMRRDTLATKLQSNNVEGFWKEVKVIDNCNTPIPTNIEGW